MRLDKTKVKTGADGTFSFADIEEGEHTLSIAKEGYEDVSQQVTVSGADLAIDPITLNKTVQVASETLKTKKMEVQIKKNFPSVLQYTMTDGKVMYGQSKDVRTVEINGTNIELGDDDVTFKKVSDTEATYTLKVKDEAKKIDAVITVQITVKANQLHLNVTKIKNNLSEGIPEGNGVEENAIQTLSFPNQSLVSVRSSQENAQFTGARMSSNTQKPGDTNFAVTEDTNVTDSDYTYGFISGAGLSAGLWSNSEHDGTYVAAPVRGGSQNTRVYATTQQTGDAHLPGPGQRSVVLPPHGHRFQGQEVHRGRNRSAADGRGHRRRRERRRCRQLAGWRNRLPRHHEQPVQVRGSSRTGGMAYRHELRLPGAEPVPHHA